MAALKAVKPGVEVWLPCEIRKGPFPNERRVFVSFGGSEWYGFVSVENLREERENKGLVRAVVVGVERDSVSVRIVGHSPEERFIKGPPEAVRERVAVTT
jgi:hypothetical protein